MREHGAFVVDGIQVSSTLQCPHCGAHFEVVPGSGKRRVWCGKCHAVTCGNPQCDTCIPIEARLENREGKKTLYDDVINEFVAKGGVLL